MQVGPAKLTIQADCELARRSLLSVFETLGASRGAFNALPNSFPEFFGSELTCCCPNLSDNAGHLFIAEPIPCPADRAFKFFIGPSNRYLELVTAIASDGDYSVDFDFHGWPSLNPRVSLIECSEESSQSK